MTKTGWMGLVALVSAVVGAGCAEAHPGHEAMSVSPFLAGLLHPLLGIDHLLALLCVGIWSARVRSQGMGIASWALPVLFTVGMLAGLGAGVAIALPSGTEAAIATSVLLLGVLVAVGLRLPTFVALPAILAFAIAHGLAHGHEAPAGTAVTFAFGMGVSSLMLQGAGIGLGALLQRHALARRGVGGAVALAGLAFLAG